MRLTPLLPAMLLTVPAMLHAAPVTLTLDNGDRLQAELLDETEQYMIFHHVVLGEIHIARGQIQTLSFDSPQTPTATDARLTDETGHADDRQMEEDNDNGLFGTGLLTNWDRHFNLGIAGSEGKSKNHQINIGFSAEYDSEQTRISHRSAYFRSESEGDLSDHSFFATLNRDWLQPDTPWFHFAGGRIDLDEFKDWDYRLAANGGLGYEFRNDDSWLVLGRAGVGANQTFGGEREEFTPEGLLGVETRWNMNDHQQIRFANTLYPSFGDMGEFRNLTSFDWILDLNSYVGVALKVGLLNEYDSQTEDGVDKNDFKYTVSLSWDL